MAREARPQFRTMVKACEEESATEDTEITERIEDKIAGTKKGTGSPSCGLPLLHLCALCVLCGKKSPSPQFWRKPV
jgi:hypothetical protein